MTLRLALKTMTIEMMLTLDVPRGAQKGHQIRLIRNSKWILFKFAAYKADSMFN